MKRLIRSQTTVEASKKNSSSYLEAKKLVEKFKRKYPVAYEVLGK